MGAFNGVQIIVSPHALENSTVRNFPAKRRSKRLHKKLCKRFGGEFRQVPCIWKTPHGIVMHPVMYAEFKRRVDADGGE